MDEKCDQDDDDGENDIDVLQFHPMFRICYNMPSSPWEIGIYVYIDLRKKLHESSRYRCIRDQ